MQTINFDFGRLYDSFLDREINETDVALIMWGAGIRIPDIERILDMLYVAERTFRADLKAEAREEFWGTNQEVYCKTRGAIKCNSR